MPGQSLDKRRHAGRFLQALALEQTDMLCEQLLHPRLVDQFDLLHVLVRAVAGREVPPHNPDRHDRPPYLDRLMAPPSE
jgi:hypothetical protein